MCWVKQPKRNYECSRATPINSIGNCAEFDKIVDTLKIK